MDINTIAQVIGSLGFPIVACVALYTQGIKSAERHKEEMDKMSEAINNNTIAITKLVDKLGDGTE